MRKRFSANKYLAVALALAEFAAVGTAPAFAQAASKYGSVLPSHYLSDGSQAPGWYAETSSPRHLAHTPSTNDEGKNAYAQVPASILNSAAPSGINYYNPATSGYDPGIDTQR